MASYFVKTSQRRAKQVTGKWLASLDNPIDVPEEKPVVIHNAGSLAVESSALLEPEPLDDEQPIPSPVKGRSLRKTPAAPVKPKRGRPKAPSPTVVKNLTPELEDAADNDDGGDTPPPPPVKYDCGLCQTSYTSKANLAKHFHTKLHMRNMEKSGAKIVESTVSHKCDYCKNTYMTEAGLKRHRVNKHATAVAGEKAAEIAAPAPVITPTQPTPAQPAPAPATPQPTPTPAPPASEKKESNKLPIIEIATDEADEFDD